MKNGLTPLWNDDDIAHWFDIFIDRAEEKIFKLLQRAGEVFVTYARNKGNYRDCTGNLRSSVGYVIVADGEILAENFEASDKGVDRMKGLGKARQLASQIGNENPAGFFLICLAGMEYAATVEARGKDVITCAVTATDEELRKQIQTIFDKAT